MSDVERQFGEWVRKRREERCWSQRQLATRLAGEGIELDPSAITRLEKGQRAIRLGEAVALAGIFGAKLTPVTRTLEERVSALEAALAVHLGGAR